MSVFLAVLALGIYFAPAIIAGPVRHKHNARRIFLFDFFLGWTFIGWLVCLIWALQKEQFQPSQATMTQQTKQGAQSPDNQAWIAPLELNLFVTSNSEQGKEINKIKHSVEPVVPKSEIASQSEQLKKAREITASTPAEHLVSAARQIEPKRAELVLKQDPQELGQLKPVSRLLHDLYRRLSVITGVFFWLCYLAAITVGVVHGFSLISWILGGVGLISLLTCLYCMRMVGIAGSVMIQGKRVERESEMLIIPPFGPLPTPVALFQISSGEREKWFECTVCAGAGQTSYTARCPSCGGRGAHQSQRGGAYDMRCTRCNGTGLVKTSRECTSCRGTGRLNVGEWVDRYNSEAVTLNEAITEISPGLEERITEFDQLAESANHKIAIWNSKIFDDGALSGARFKPDSNEAIVWRLEPRVSLRRDALKRKGISASIYSDLLRRKVSYIVTNRRAMVVSAIQKDILLESCDFSTGVQIEISGRRRLSNVHWERNDYTIRRPLGFKYLPLWYWWGTYQPFKWDIDFGDISFTAGGNPAVTFVGVSFPDLVVSKIQAGMQKSGS